MMERLVTPLTMLRRFVFWTLVCTLSAWPSFLFARDMRASLLGMFAGVGVFIILYTLASSTQRFEQVYRRPFIRETMYVGYGLRVAISILVLLSYLNNPTLKPAGFWMAPDVWCGVVSAFIVGALGNASQELSMFSVAFLMTCVQGVLLNIVVGAVMIFTYIIQRATRPWPENDPSRGFEVMSVATNAAD